jgi:RNA polymerase sigma-70 factor (ECF subfamily)
MKEELTLINLLKQGNERAFSRLYDSYSGALYGVILRICRNELMAQEVLQETFMKIWQSADSYNPDKGRFYTWAYRIARNSALNAIRNTSNLIQMEDLGVYKDKEDEEQIPVDLGKLNGAMNALEQHHQKALELVYFKGLTHMDAHKEMEVPLGTFKSYVRQALKQLRSSYTITIVGICLLMERIL